jgi:DNA-binding HxlR family transcriptional regulator
MTKRHEPRDPRRDPLRRDLESVEPAVRAQLLRLLESADVVRADVIRQAYERPSTRWLAETLMDLEADELMRERLRLELLRLAREEV